MPEIWYAALKPFTPENEEAWSSYSDFAQLPQLREVVSLDILLCPNVLKELTDQDWEHNIHEDFCTSYFRDFEYLHSRVAGEVCNLLAIMNAPEEDPRATFADPRFVFVGYDLVEAMTGISALTNCGGFPRAFAPTDLSPFGLLSDWAYARVVQARLREEYPDEQHADCDIWAIWRLADA